MIAVEWHGDSGLSMSNRDVLIVPTFSRPELLWLCLDHLAACAETVTLDIRIVVDAHVGKPPPLSDIRYVVSLFPQLPITLIERPPHTYSGNSFNVLMAYQEAIAAHPRFIYLVEDDVMVSPTFFQWHQVVHQTCRPACSIGVQKTARMQGYASLGVCFPLATVTEIVAHCRPAYFSDMRAYCKQQFPPSSFEFEQDGLICRVLVGKPVIWATSPHAQHVGWYGYHRPRSERPRGTVEQRYHRVKQVLSDGTQLTQCAKEFGDVEPLHLHWQSSARNS